MDNLQTSFSELQKRLKELCPTFRPNILPSGFNVFDICGGSDSDKLNSLLGNIVLLAHSNESAENQGTSLVPIVDVSYSNRNYIIEDIKVIRCVLLIIAHGKLDC